MASHFTWTEAIYTEFVRLAMLNELEKDFVKARILGHTTVQQSLEFNMSKSSVTRMHKKLKRKYDEAQKLSSKLPPRK